MQIIPAIDIRGGRCVRLKQGDYAQETVFEDDPLSVARRWQNAGAARLHLVDLDAARAGGPVNRETISTITSSVTIPCQLGGGMRSEDSIRTMLEEVGVERVIVGTRALKDPAWFRSMAAMFPGRVALGLDAKNGHVAVDGWTNVSTVSVMELAAQFADLELAALIYTNIAQDGMLEGMDEQTVGQLQSLAQFGQPVIASGGVTTREDVRRLAAASRQSPALCGAIVGRALYEGTLDLAEAIRLTED